MAEPVDADRRLDALVAALRDTPRVPPAQAAATRRRMLETLAQRSRVRRRRVTFAAIALTLGTGTMSWAATGGRLEPLLTRIGLRAAVVAPADMPAEVIDAPAPEPTPARPAQVTIAALEQTMPPAPPPAPELAPPVAPRPAPRAVAVATTIDDEAPFRRAHELHFRGGDAAAALAAWDDYLAAHADGRLAVEARWNRALALVKLGRHDDATAALAPFARGEVAPAGYRRAEAIALTDALARRRTRRIDAAASDP